MGLRISKYNVQSMPEALEQYWNHYYQTCEQLEKKYQRQIKLFETESLSKKRKLEFWSFVIIKIDHEQ